MFIRSFCPTITPPPPLNYTYKVALIILSTLALVACDDNPAVGVFSGAPSDSFTDADFLRSTTEVTVTYAGDAVGVYGTISQKEGFRAFAADITLQATFGTSTPKVEGTIDNFRFFGASTAFIPESITLQEADLANSAGGFFRGTTLAIGSAPSIGDWGGRFYGDVAEAVSGTFGTESETIAGFHGAFGVQKQ